MVCARLESVFHIYFLADRLGRYGGILLGPARFQHIETCAMEACKSFKQTEELEDCITTLRMLDDMLGERRKKLQSLRDRSAPNPPDDGGPASSPTVVPSDGIQCPTTNRGGEDNLESKKNNPATPKVPVDYSKLDIAKAKRLVKAREGSVQSVNALIAKEESLS